MYQFLSERPVMAIVCIILILAFFCIIAVKVMQSVGMEKVRKTVYNAFILAENSFRHGENQEKFEYVVNAAKKAIPTPYNLFITEAALRKVIQLWFTLCKDLLDDGRMNGTGKASNE